MQKIRLKNTPYVMDVEVENKEEFVKTLNKLMNDFIFNRCDLPNEDDYELSIQLYFFSHIVHKFGIDAMYYDYCYTLRILAMEIKDIVEGLTDESESKTNLKDVDFFEVAVVDRIDWETLKYIPINDVDNNNTEFVNMLGVMGRMLGYVVLAPMLASGELKY